MSYDRKVLLDSALDGPSVPYLSYVEGVVAGSKPQGSMTFLQAARTVLREHHRPLTAREITELAQTAGLIATAGKTPWQTMKSKLSTDILRRGQMSDFMRTGMGRFGLREWRDELDEYVAPRYQKTLMDEAVVVFDRSRLRDYIPGPGLFTAPVDSENLLNELRPMQRRQAEDDFSVIQLVSVFVLRHRDRFLTYKRSKRLPENRLHGEYSVAFGGHLNPDDVSPLLNIFNPDVGLPLLLRELHEEVRLRVQPTISYRGLLYDDSRELSQQHLGIVYDVVLPTPLYEIGERGFLIDPKLETKDQIVARIHDFENWSALLMFSYDAEVPRLDREVPASWT